MFSLLLVAKLKRIRFIRPKLVGVEGLVRLRVVRLDELRSSGGRSTAAGRTTNSQPLPDVVGAFDDFVSESALTVRLPHEQLLDAHRSCGLPIDAQCLRRTRRIYLVHRLGRRGLTTRL